MIYSRKYSRNFIPLKQDNPKHNLDFRPSLGKCVIEIKDNTGKISIYAQGIKPKTTYHLELIGFEKGNVKNTSLGTFNVDAYGRGEFSKIFNPDNVLDSNNKIEDFNVISVLVKDENDISSALVGYVDGEIDWQDSYKTSFFNRRKECCCNPKPETNPEQTPEQTPEENTKPSEKEQGLIDKEQGLLEKEQGLIDKEKGLIEKEKNKDKATKIPLEDYEKKLTEKLKGLLEKEMGLMEREQGLLERERALKQGNLPKEDKDIEKRELEIIAKEESLLKKEQELLKREQELVRKNPTNEKEAGLIEKEKGILQKEAGLIERERGLIEKEKGLIELEKGLRESKKQVEEKQPEENNHDNFKKMLENLRESMLNIQNIYEKPEYNYSLQNIDNNIEYIKINNAKMTPFQDSDIDWYRISPCELSAISKNAEKYQDNLLVALSYKKYRHIMLGIKQNQDNTEDYLLAIPSEYEDNFNLKSFSNFVALDNNISTNGIKSGEYGYRIEIL